MGSRLFDFLCRETIIIYGAAAPFCIQIHSSSQNRKKPPIYIFSNLWYCININNTVDTDKDTLSVRLERRHQMLIELDYKDRRPIYEQVTEKLASMMMLGVLEENSQLPSVRSMAVALSINPNTIQRAYAELERQGYIYSVKGKGSFVTDTSKMKEFRQKEARGKVAEAAREAARLGLAEEEILEAAKEGIHTEVKEEIHAAVREESREAGSTGTDAGQMPLKQMDTGGNEHD